MFAVDPAAPAAAVRLVAHDRLPCMPCARTCSSPVHPLAADGAAGLRRILSLAPGSADEVESHLQEAAQWMARGGGKAAFASAARALQKAPDQPGIVADVARLLASLGKREHAVAV